MTNLFYFHYILLLGHSSRNSCLVSTILGDTTLVSLPCSKQFIFKRKLTGKGHSTISMSTAHDIPATELIIHHTQVFLSYHDKFVLSRVSSTYIAYASLRYEATHVPRNLLRAQLSIYKNTNIKLLFTIDISVQLLICRKLAISLSHVGDSLIKR